MRRLLFHAIKMHGKDPPLWLTAPSSPEFPMFEEELVRRVIAGDLEAEEKFSKMFSPRLFRASKYILGGQESEARDIVQETFVVALPKLQSYSFKAPIYAWLSRICLSLSYARLRTRYRLLKSVEEGQQTR